MKVNIYEATYTYYDGVTVSSKRFIGKSFDDALEIGRKLGGQFNRLEELKLLLRDIENA